MKHAVHMNMDKTKVSDDKTAHVPKNICTNIWFGVGGTYLKDDRSCFNGQILPIIDLFTINVS